MKPATQEVLDVAVTFIRRGHARDRAAVEALSRPASPEAAFVFPSSPDPALTENEFVSHLAEYPPCFPTGFNPSGFMTDEWALVVDGFQVEIPGEEPIRLRSTVLLTRDGSTWKVTHAHLSEGVAHLAD